MGNVRCNVLVIRSAKNGVIILALLAEKEFVMRYLAYSASNHLLKGVFSSKCFPLISCSLRYKVLFDTPRESAIVCMGTFINLICLTCPRVKSSFGVT